MMRYNTDAQTNGQLEIYNAGRWRAIRFAEQGQITQQNLGAGDSSTVYFGPLNSTYYNPSNNANNATIGGQNILVIVENVIQVSTVNYTIVQNPTIAAESYSAYVSQATSAGNSTIYFNTSLMATSAGGTGSVATLYFTNQTGIPFAVGSTIIVTGMTPSTYNGSFTVTASTSTSVSYSSTATGSMTFAGNIASTNAVYPAVNIVGATVTGSSYIQSSTSVLSYATDPNTDALLSITLNKTLTGTIAVNTAITIAESSQSATGYYLQFTSPVPYGKTVTALLGFDS
jgi:hypothetical protein